MAEVPILVPDANTALRWLLPERSLSAEATQMVSDFAGGHINLVAPYHFPMEVGSGLRRQVATHKMTHTEARRRFDRFLATNIPTRDVQGLIEKAFDNCQRFSISIRDSLYVSLAEVYQVPLLTADEDLLRALSRFPFKMFLADYQTSGV